MTSIQTIKAALYEGIKPASPYLVSTEIPAPVAQARRRRHQDPGQPHGQLLQRHGHWQLPLPQLRAHGPGVWRHWLTKSVGPGLVHLKSGQMVFIDPVVHARDHPIGPLAMMQGFVGFGEGGLKLQQVWRHGSWTEETVVPAENVAVIPPMPYGGFTAAGQRAGQTVVVNGSMGTFGASTVAVALAMGVRRVIAMGRTRTQLDEYVKVYGPRVVHFVPTGDEAKDTEDFVQAAGEGFAIDLVFDRLPPVASFGIVRSAISALCASDTAVLMGGVQANIEIEYMLPYSHIMLNNITIKGKFMSVRADPTTLLGLVDAGLLRLDVGEYKTFKLEEINEAIDWSAAN
ncbi:hypothetical protein BGZ74_006241 [Mortierella antarctica]|nr:hypothetical protein BGZ74_006241 [Mortierella antarctica]